jgi:hypothetical protein
MNSMRIQIFILLSCASALAAAAADFPEPVLPQGIGVMTILRCSDFVSPNRMTWRLRSEGFGFSEYMQAPVRLGCANLGLNL